MELNSNPQCTYVCALLVFASLKKSYQIPFVQKYTQIIRGGGIEASRSPAQLRKTWRMEKRKKLKPRAKMPYLVYIIFLPSVQKKKWSKNTATCLLFPTVQIDLHLDISLSRAVAIMSVQIWSRWMTRSMLIWVVVLPWVITSTIQKSDAASLLAWSTEKRAICSSYVLIFDWSPGCNRRRHMSPDPLSDRQTVMYSSTIRSFNQLDLSKASCKLETLNSSTCLSNGLPSQNWSASAKALW